MYNKVIHWYYVGKYKNGKEYIFSYGDNLKYTQEESYEKAKERCPECKIASEEDCNRIL